MADSQLRRRTTVTQQTTVTQPDPTTEELKKHLLELYNSGKEVEFKKEIVSLIASHREYFRVVELQNDKSSDVTKETFVRHFSSTLNKELAEALFNVMSDDKKTVNVMNLNLQFQQRRRTTIRQREIVKDAQWLMHRLQNLDLKDIDKDGDLKIQRQELRDYFKDELDAALVDQIYDAIDVDESGFITPMEYFRWRGNAKLGAINTFIKQAEAARTGVGASSIRFVISEENEQDFQEDPESNDDKKQENTSKNEKLEEIEKQKQKQKEEQERLQKQKEEEERLQMQKEKEKQQSLKDDSLNVVSIDTR